MNYPIAMMLLQIVVRSALVSFMCYELYRRGDVLNSMERRGMALVAGCTFMTIPVYMDIHRDGTPFDNWAALGLAMGVLIAGVGREIRHRGHDRRTRKTVAQAREHFARKSQ